MLHRIPFDNWEKQKQTTSRNPSTATLSPARIGNPPPKKTTIKLAMASLWFPFPLQKGTPPTNKHIYIYVHIYIYIYHKKSQKWLTQNYIYIYIYTPKCKQKWLQVFYPSEPCFFTPPPFRPQREAPRREPRVGPPYGQLPHLLRRLDYALLHLSLRRRARGGTRNVRVRYAGARKTLTCSYQVHDSSSKCPSRF